MKIIISAVALVLLIALSSTSGMAQRENTPSLRDDLVKIGATAILGIIDFFHRDDLLTKTKLSQVRNALDRLQRYLSYMDEAPLIQACRIPLIEGFEALKIL
jgi:hypothetical protein